MFLLQIKVQHSAPWITFPHQSRQIASVLPYSPSHDSLVQIFITSLDPHACRHFSDFNCQILYKVGEVIKAGSAN